MENKSNSVPKEMWCWQRVVVVLSSMWVVLLLGVTAVNTIQGEPLSLMGVILTLGIAFIPPVLLYGIGTSVSFLLCRIRKTAR